MNNLKGIFTGKREKVESPPPMPSTDLAQITSPRKRRVTAEGSPVAASHRTPAHTNDQAALSAHVHTGSAEARKIADFAISAWNEASDEQDLSKKERLLSMASVMLDALSNSREAEKSMLEARQAAASARVSYEMTQRSITEMGRLLGKSYSMPAFMRKFTARTSR